MSTATRSDMRAPSPSTGRSTRVRRTLERQATELFVGFMVAVSLVCGAVIISGWFAGVLFDPAERVFWAGAVLAGITLAVFAIATFPGGRDDARESARIRWAIRLGLLFAVLSPALCVGALIADFYR